MLRGNSYRLLDPHLTCVTLISHVLTVEVPENESVSVTVSEEPVPMST